MVSLLTARCSACASLVLPETPREEPAAATLEELLKPLRLLLLEEDDQQAYACKQKNMSH